MRQLAQITHLVHKDLRMYFQQKDTAILVLLFSLLVVLVFCFAFGPIFPQDLIERGKLAGSVLWAAFAFGGVIALSRTFTQEREHGALNAILLTGIDPANLYLAKVISSALFLTFLEIILTPVTLILMSVMDRLTPVDVLALIGVIALGTLGFSAIGMILAAMTNTQTGQDSLLSVILFPMLFPVVIGASRVTIGILTYHELQLRGIPASPGGQWLVLLVVYTLLFLTVSYLLFEYVLEQ